MIVVQCPECENVDPATMNYVEVVEEITAIHGVRIDPDGTQTLYLDYQHCGSVPGKRYGPSCWLECAVCGTEFPVPDNVQLSSCDGWEFRNQAAARAAEAPV